MAHHQQHHHGGGHSVVRIVQGKSTELTFIEFLSKFKKSFWIVCIIGGISGIVGYLAVIHHPAVGIQRHLFKPRAVVSESRMPSGNKTNLRDDRNAGKEEIFKWNNARKNVAK